MRPDLVDRAAPPLYALVDLAVILAPALAIWWPARAGGVPDTGADLVLGSAAVGGVHAVVAWRRLASDERRARRRVDMWIAALNALVVLALGATLLLVVVLRLFSDEHASLARQDYPVVALWVGLQVVAVGLAELTGRWVFRWLEPADVPDGPSGWRPAVGGSQGP